MAFYIQKSQELSFEDETGSDDEQCSTNSLHSNTCCSFNSPPWFNVQLPNATTDDIAIVFGTDNIQTIADTPVEFNLN